MHYSIIISSLAALAVAVPVDMNDVKQARDVDYGVYKNYGKYGEYGGYPWGVEEAAAKMQQGMLCLLCVAYVHRS